MTVLRAALILVLALALPAAASAQPASGSDALKSRLEPGLSVTVTDVDGRTFKGDIADLNGSALVLQHSGWTSNADRQTLDMNRVTRIKHRDGLGNGVFIGLGAGVLVAYGAIKGICGPNDSECEAIVTTVLGLPIIAGSGVLGAGIDFAMQKTLFAAPGPTPARISVAPLIGRRAGGAALALTF